MRKRGYLFVSLLFISCCFSGGYEADYEYMDEEYEYIDEEFASELNAFADELEEDLRSLDDRDDDVLYEEYADSPEDCTQYEKYDVQEQTCYYECETNAECDAIEDKIEGELEKLGDEYEDFSQDFKEFEGDSVELEKNAQAVYRIQPGERFRLVSGAEQGSDLKIKNWLKTISPDSFSDKYIDRLLIYRMAGSDEAGSVVPNLNNGKWDMYINVDVIDDSEREMVFTLVHEFAHILTLNYSQVDNTIESEARCQNHFIDEGCTRTHSYFANFHKIFWRGRYTKEEDVYNDHPRDFVSDYAGTNAVEDLAETFAVFVFNQKKQSANTVAERKINFFHRYQELAAMRANIRAALKPFVHKRLRGL